MKIEEENNYTRRNLGYHNRQSPNLRDMYPQSICRRKLRGFHQIEHTLTECITDLFAET